MMEIAIFVSHIFLLGAMIWSMLAIVSFAKSKWLIFAVVASAFLAEVYFMDTYFENVDTMWYELVSLWQESIITILFMIHLIKEECK